MQQTTIKFPEIRLHPRAAHKLRGYFGNLFKERSDLLHNHLKDGSSIYRYPLVQYKVVDTMPLLLGIGEGAPLLLSLFRELKELDIAGKKYPIAAKDLCSEIPSIGVSDDLFTYKFDSPWLALNQKNYDKYIEVTETGKQALLQRILITNIIGFFNGVGYRETQKILAKPHLKEVKVNFKGQGMTGFRGTFTTNVRLPQYIGLGKSVSRGFGTVVFSA